MWGNQTASGCHPDSAEPYHQNEPATQPPRGCPAFSKAPTHRQACSQAGLHMLAGQHVPHSPLNILAQQPLQLLRYQRLLQSCTCPARQRTHVERGPQHATMYSAVVNHCASLHALCVYTRLPIWFAKPWSAKCPAFYSQYLMLGAAGVNAFDHSCNMAQARLQGKQQGKDIEQGGGGAGSWAHRRRLFCLSVCCIVIWSPHYWHKLQAQLR